MSKARVLGQSALIKVRDPGTGLDIKIGEVDKFTAKSTSSLVKSRPIGTSLQTPHLQYGGWELSFSGGKIDWNLANTIHAQDVLLRSAGDYPAFNVESTIRHSDGSNETYLYVGVLIFGYEETMNTGEEIGETFNGFSPERNQLGVAQLSSGIYDIINASLKNVVDEAVRFLADDAGMFQ